MKLKELRKTKVPYGDTELFHFGPQRTFEGEALSQIAFPLGGIGTGTISLGGRGQLKNWEIFNRPNKGFSLPYSFFAIRAREKGKNPVARVLESKLLPPFGRGSGLPLHTVPGLPRMHEARFTGSYPFAHIEFFDSTLPVKIKLRAFNPFIPLNDLDSGLPVAIFYFSLENNSEKEVEVLLAGSLLNAIGCDGKPDFGGKNLNEFVKEVSFTGIKMTGSKYPTDDPRFGSMAVVTTAKDITYRLRWLRESGWGEHLQDFWREFRYKEHLGEETSSEASPDGGTDIGTLGINLKLSPHERCRVPIIITWYFPNMLKYWKLNPDEKTGQVFRLYYATKFSDAWDVARYIVDNLSRLELETERFHTALFSSSLPSYVLDALSSQVSTIRTNTCFRLSDGNFYGFEGSGDNKGSAPLNCTHVWNYEQTLAFLFPQLERTMRKVDFLANTDEKGKMVFRTILPLGSGRWNSKPAADGQMGTIMRLYREWKFSGDTQFLSSIWPKAKKALEFAWQSWDSNRDGLIEGEQHNTYDIEFYGPNSMVGTLYLGALKAAEEMARALGEDALARSYRDLFEKGKDRLDKELFNGEYYIQKYDARKITRNQYGKGCLSDQLLGEWLAQIAGLGELLPQEHIRSALLSIFKYNWREDFFTHSNCFRTYVLNDEKGLLLCSWPRGERPEFPFGFCDEVWTGIEYQVAAHLIYEGFLKEGLSMVKGLRERHDGLRRNPWDEPEAGHHYVRAMASWSLLLALSGYSFNALNNSLGFNPRINRENFRCFFSINTGWGEFSQRIGQKSYTARIRLLWGRATIESLNLRIREKYRGPCEASVTTKTGKRKIPLTTKNGQFTFSEAIELHENDELILTRHQ